MNTTWLQVIGMVTGFVILGEAFALILGMHLLSRGENPWATKKNNLLLGLDVLFGITFLWAIFVDDGYLIQAILLGTTVIHILSHAYRSWEYGAKRPNPFCTNLPLFMVNDVKLILLVLIFLIAMSFGMKSE